MTTGHALIFDVSSVLGELGSTLEIDADVPLGSIHAGDVTLEFASPPRMRATITNAGDVLTVTGTVESTATVECARCLEPFHLSLSGTLESVVPLTDDAVPAGEDEEWNRLDGDTVDLLPAAESAIRMEAPFAPVHDESCRGICPLCGCDLNRDECGCEPESSGPDRNPFTALRELLPPGDR